MRSELDRKVAIDDDDLEVRADELEQPGSAAPAH